MVFVDGCGPFRWTEIWNFLLMELIFVRINHTNKEVECNVTVQNGRANNPQVAKNLCFDISVKNPAKCFIHSV